jgi:hypothetical protein
MDNYINYVVYKDTNMRGRGIKKSAFRHFLLKMEGGKRGSNPRPSVPQTDALTS